MWAYAMVAPGRLERVEAPVPDVVPGRVLVKLAAGGICGSDLPSFLGKRNPFVDFFGAPGFPLHEVVGEVVDGDLPAGTRVVGWAEGHRGLAEYFLARVDNVLEIDGELRDADATVIQPLCTVLHALDRLGDVAGRHVAVLGQGPIGILFSHALKARGARVTGVDRVDRRELRFGVDEVVWGDATDWAASLADDGPEIVVEAIGHQAGTLEAAVEAVAPGGVVLAFGVPDESHYSFPFARFFRKNATLIAGVTTDRRHALAAARDHLGEHPALLAPYVTDVFAIEQAQAAFECAIAPAPGRLKVVLDVAASR
jgi:threonine dehydrogenase-like Zn-dependent dehydrogenase